MKKYPAFFEVYIPHISTTEGWYKEVWNAKKAPGAAVLVENEEFIPERILMILGIPTLFCSEEEKEPFTAYSITCYC